MAKERVRSYWVPGRLLVPRCVVTWTAVGAEVCRGSVYIFFLVAVTSSDKTLTKKERDRATAEVGCKI